MLNIIINCVHFCGVFELALKGHDETKESTNLGVSRGLIWEFVIFKMQPYLRELNDSNELLQIMLEVYYKKLQRKLRKPTFWLLLPMKPVMCPLCSKLRLPTGI